MRRHASRWISVTCSLVAFFSMAGTAAVALPPTLATTSPSISLAPVVGPPTIETTVSGSGYASGERVMIAFDGVRLRVALTDGAGSFTRLIAVPASATPGDHTVQATGRTSGLTASATFLVRTDWPQYQRTPDHAGSDRYENVLVPSTAGRITSLRTLTDTSAHFSSPVTIAGGVAYVRSMTGPDTDTLIAFDPSTVTELWTFQLNGPSTQPAVSDGVVYVANGVANQHVPELLRAIDAATGIERWDVGVANSNVLLQQLAVSNGLVYEAASGHIDAFDASTGTEVWSKLGGSTEGGTAFAVSGKRVFTTNLDETGICALDAATGRNLWCASGPSGFLYSLSTSGGIVFLSFNSSVEAFDGARGAPLWTFATTGLVKAPVAVADGIAYITSLDGTLYAVDATSGAELWRESTLPVDGSVPALAAGGVVYASLADGSIVALDGGSGAVLWTGGHETLLSVSDGILYGTNSGHTVAEYGLGP